MDKQEERIIMEQQKQIEIDKISDLELADILATQMTLLYQTQQNVVVLQNELQRRKQLTENQPNSDKAKRKEQVK